MNEHVNLRAQKDAETAYREREKNKEDTHMKHITKRIPALLMVLVLALLPAPALAADYTYPVSDGAEKRKFL